MGCFGPMQRNKGMQPLHSLACNVNQIDDNVISDTQYSITPDMAVVAGHRQKKV